MATTNVYKGGRPVVLFPETGRGTYTGHPTRISSVHMERGYYTLTHALHPKVSAWQQKYLQGLRGAQVINLIVVPEMHTILAGSFKVTDDIVTGGPFATGPTGCDTACDANLVFDIKLDRYAATSDIGTVAPTSSVALATGVAYTTNQENWLNIPSLVRVNKGESAVIALYFTTGIPATSTCTMADITRYVGVQLGVQAYDYQTMV